MKGMDGSSLEEKHLLAPFLLACFVQPQGDPGFPLFQTSSYPSDLLTALYPSTSSNLQTKSSLLPTLHARPMRSVTNSSSSLTFITLE